MDNFSARDIHTVYFPLRYHAILIERGCMHNSSVSSIVYNLLLFFSQLFPQLLSVSASRVPSHRSKSTIFFKRILHPTQTSYLGSSACGVKRESVLVLKGNARRRWIRNTYLITVSIFSLRTSNASGACLRARCRVITHRFNTHNPTCAMLAS